LLDPLARALDNQSNSEAIIEGGGVEQMATRRSPTDDESEFRKHVSGDTPVTLPFRSLWQAGRLKRTL
jgi:hypothetical protein